MFNYSIVKGSANFLLVCLCYEDASGRTMSGSEIIEAFGPCAAGACSGTKRALVKLCEDEGYNIVK